MQYGYASGETITFPKAFASIPQYVNYQPVPSGGSSAGFQLVDWSNSDSSSNQAYSVTNTSFNKKPHYGSQVCFWSAIGK